MAAELIYGQVKKIYQRRKLVRVKQVMRLGTQTALQVTLQGLSFSGRLNTAFIERVNLTVRHGIAALARPPGRLLSSPHPCSPIWSGGVPTTILCVPTHHCAWRSSSHKHEGATDWLNATGSGRQLWQPGEPIGDGQRVRCSLTHCRQFPLESPHARCCCRSMPKVQAEDVGWSFLPGEDDVSGLYHDEKMTPKWVWRG